MAGFHLYSSNRQEILVETLATLLQQPLQNPLQAEHIVVQHYGMRRWVSLRLAEHNRIEANTRYLSPHELLHVGFEQIIAGYQPTKIMEEEHLTWVLLALLQQAKEHPQLTPLAHYFQEGNPLKEWQLAKRIAQLFDQYNEFLPEMILGWEKSNAEHWQSALWKGMPANIRQRQKPFLRKKFLHAAKTNTAPLEPSLERISVFSLFALPPLHLEVLAGLAEVMDVHFFAFLPAEMNPSSKNLPAHPLLKTLGKAGNNFIKLMRHHHLLTEAVLEKSYFPNHQPPAGASLLEKIQKAFANDRDPISPPPDKALIEPQDRSIQVHSCHTPMREVEVLHDQLLCLLDENPQLAPDDILVMAPEIEDYAPFIQSVFSGGAGQAVSPFSIADRKVHPESKIVSYLLDLLRMAKSRFTLTEVVSLLESEAIQKRFGLQEAHLRLLKNWFAHVHICWGTNAPFRQKQNFPRTHENTWEFGMERLLTGYALVGKGQIVFENILPFDAVEGHDALVLGNFLNFFEKLTALVGDSAASLLHPRSLRKWADCLRGLLTDFFVQETAWNEEWQLFWKVAEDLESIQKDSGVEAAFPIEVLVQSLEEKLQRELSQRGFLGHGITFSSMRPMRSIPFKVIALLGMNEKAFPRRRNPLSFDLLASHENSDDLFFKEEDRYLFLETLLSCRQVLYISYLGQGVRDNDPLLPSIVVTELLEHIQQTYGIPLSQSICPHHLQAFHPAYFQKEGLLLSYSHDHWQNAQALVQPPAPAALFEVQLPAPEASWHSLTIEQLVRFFKAPAQFLLTQRMGVYLGKQESLLTDEEPFLIDGLQKYQIQTQQIEWLIQERKLEGLWKLMKAEGHLPAGVGGKQLWEAIYIESFKFFSDIESYLHHEPLPPLSYDFTLAGVRLKGEIGHIGALGLVRFRPAQVKIKDRLQIWLEQLVLNLEPHRAYPTNAILIGKDSKTATKQLYACPAIENPQKHLQTLLELYQRGLQEPLAFFPETAGVYVSGWLKFNEAKAQEKALQKWFGNDYKKGELYKNLYFQRCFEHLDLWKDTDFESIALNVLAPLLASQKEEK